MQLRMLTGGVAFVALFVLFTGWVVSREPSPPPMHDHPGSVTPEPLPVATEPGEHHAHLELLVGKWDVVVRWRATSDAPWNESTCSASYEWVTGGRFLIQKIEGAVTEDQPFEGMGFLGYDNRSKRHTLVWIDSTGTETSFGEGTCDDSGKIITMFSEYTRPSTGGRKQEVSLLHILSDDRHIFEICETGPGRKGLPTLEITYTRKQ